MFIHAVDSGFWIIPLSIRILDNLTLLEYSMFPIKSGLQTAYWSPVLPYFGAIFLRRDLDLGWRIRNKDFYYEWVFLLKKWKTNKLYCRGQKRNSFEEIFSSSDGCVILHIGVCHLTQTHLELLFTATCGNVISLCKSLSHAALKVSHHLKKTVPFEKLGQERFWLCVFAKWFSWLIFV